MREFWRRKRADGSLGAVLWTNLHGRRVSTGCPDLRSARAWKAARVRDGADPRRAAAESARLDDAIREFYAELRRRGRATATQLKNRQKLGHFPRLWGKDLRLSMVNATLVDSYIDARLLEGGSRKGTTVSRLTIRDELVALRQVLALARRQGRFHVHPDDVLPERFETGHQPRRDWVRWSDLPRLLDHVQPRHAAHLLFFVCTGGRLADSYRSLRADWDLSKGRETVLVRGSKTRASWRRNPIPEHLVESAHRLLRDAEGDDVLFVTWPKIDRDIKAACLRAGIPQVSTNGLRRTFGHSLRLHGYSLDVISKLFGHTTEKLARDVYADVDGDELRTAMEASRQYKSGTRRDPREEKLNACG